MNVDYIVGIVGYTGKETKIMLNQGYLTIFVIL